MTEEERLRTIRLKLSRIDDRPASIPPLPSGYPQIDELLGGGFPRGRIVELFGADDTGKTTLALSTIAEVQRQGGAATLIDADYTFDPAYASACGIALERLVVARPEWGEQALEIVRALAASGALDLIVVDSAAALVPKLELESGLENVLPGLQGAVLSRALRKLAAAALRTGTCLLFLNQLRSGATADSAPSATGGRGLKLYAALRIELLPAAAGKVRVHVIKNKLGSAFGEIEVRLRQRA